VLCLTIRRTLLIAFLLAGLVPSALLAWLAFEFASNALHLEIEQSLKVEAAAISQDIDKMLFERLQNAQTWSRLEVMQELQVNDVDKRISNFLAGLKAGYRDVYTDLACVDIQGRVLASSDVAAVGLPAVRSETAAFTLPGDASIRLQHLRFGAHGGAVLPIEADLHSMFNNQVIGQLQLMFNWAQIYQILDQAERGSRSVLLVDPDGKIIAASSALRSRGMLSQSLPRDWLAGSAAVSRRDGSFVQESELTIGADRSRGFQHFPGFGWTTIVLQPSRQAFVPVRHMALVFVLLLVLTSTLVAALSALIAGRIARPIAALTRLTGDYSAGHVLPAIAHGSGGEVGALTDAFVQMMTKLEQSRADLVRASKLAALGELSAMMAHEIRTPIGILRSSAQMLAREPGLSDEGRELTSFIESETERLNGLVSTLLDGTRTREPQWRSCDMNDLIHQSIGLLAVEAEKKRIAVTAQLEQSAAIIECDAEQMTQVLLNLLHNALQILPHGGRVEVSCRQAEGRTVVALADDGPGIAAQELPRVFEPFFTKRDGGIGLGLAVVQRIVIAHKGTISAGRSRFGGALFTLNLPSVQDV
jgi:two-component system, NtrC family, sensor histidine kinase HydH